MSTTQSKKNKAAEVKADKTDTDWSLDLRADYGGREIHVADKASVLTWWMQ